MNEKYEINELPLGALVPFKNHPFKVIENEELTALAQSIKESGVLVPALARPAGDRYELISGHRRLAVCKLLGLSTIPVIVRDLTDAEAIITMVDANLQREHILCCLQRGHPARPSAARPRHPHRRSPRQFPRECR